jgi:hypothetical protein
MFVVPGTTPFLFPATDSKSIMPVPAFTRTPVLSAKTMLEKSTILMRVSSDFGQLAVNRHLIVGVDWAMAGAATADAAIPVAGLAPPFQPTPLDNSTGTDVCSPISSFAI